jgi:hypothetical protein
MVLLYVCYNILEYIYSDLLPSDERAKYYNNISVERYLVEDREKRRMR